MKVFSRKIQAITLLLATTASLLFTIKTHYEASRSMDAQYIGNLRHSQAEPVATATTAPSVKLRKEGDNVSLPSESDIDVAPDHSSSSAPPIGAWQIMPAKDATSHGVELNPTTYICACAKCGSTSLYSELFAIVHGRSFASMNYTGPPWIHELTNQKLWENIQAKRLVDDWPKYDDFKKHGSFALIRDPRERIVSAWKSKVSCVEAEVPGHKRLVPHLLELAGPIDNVTARTDLGFPCMDLSDYLSVLSQIHTQGNEGLLDEHFRPQHLGCFKDIPPSMWTVVTTIADPNTRCSLKSVLLKNSPTNSLDATDNSGCLMMKSHERKNNINLTDKDEVILDQITRREYEMLMQYLHAPDANSTITTAS